MRGKSGAGESTSGDAVDTQLALANRQPTWSWLEDARWDAWIDTVAVLLLAIASLAAAWSGFQAAQWGGEQSTLYSQASARRVEASQASTSAYLDTMVDIGAFDNCANAYAAGDTELMTFHRRRFSDRLAPAVEAWLAADPLNSSDAPESPFEMPEYVVPEGDRAGRLTAEAEDLFARGMRASDRSDDYLLNTVYLATVLFFAGIVTRFKSRRSRLLLDALSVALLLYGVYHVVALRLEGGSA